VISREKARGLCRELRSQGRRVVFTNGVFDLLHAGHVDCLERARALGDVLIVGLNSDASARLIKGPGRPLVPQGDRARVLAALACVDYVVLFDEPTAEELVRALRPDVYVKGGDYGEREPPEARLVAEYGGRVEIMPFLPGRSTTAIIRTILERYAGKR